MNNKVRSKNWWDDFWANKTQDFGPPTQTLLNFAQGFIKNGTGFSSIDIASGNGRYAIPLAKMGYQSSALEFSKAGCNRITQRAETEKVDIQVINNDAITFCSGKSSFYDVVLSSGLLEETDPKLHGEIAKGLMSITKPGGMNIVKYCLSIIDRGTLVKKNMIPKLYQEQGWKIVYFEQDNDLRQSQANINFEKKIQTEMVVAIKPGLVNEKI